MVKPSLHVTRLTTIVGTVPSLGRKKLKNKLKLGRAGGYGIAQYLKRREARS